MQMYKYPQSPEGASDLLELELQVVVNCLHEY